ncbi:MAG: cytochrome c oxidase assembly protein [Proteobacteria bacterium]|nr:cytochrome c oxidase assembly protein [Pseudomonadota bacterium]
MASATGKTVARLSLIVVGMFAFGFALVPLYDLLCEVTGLGGKTGDAVVYDQTTVEIDSTRTIKVTFLTQTNGGMPWTFWADAGRLDVHPGELHTITFQVRNPTDRVMRGQAVPSVVPGRAAEFFHKVQCFCFDSQVLAPGEQMPLTVKFTVDAMLPSTVESIVLSYELFDITTEEDAAATADLASTASGASRNSSQQPSGDIGYE